MQPAAVYDHRSKTFERIHAKRKKLAERLGNVRLAVFVLGLIATFILYRIMGPTVGLSTGFLALLLYTYVVFRHRRILRHLRYVNALRSINEQGAARVSGRWTEFDDAGSDFRDDNHPFASDLDLFGVGSLFQWMNTTTTPLGRESLACILKNENTDRTEILARQEAVAELARNIAWRQRFQAEGLLAPTKDHSTEPLLRWARTSNEAYLRRAIRVGMRVLPAVAITSIILSVTVPTLSWHLPAILLGFQTLLLFLGGKTISQELSEVYQQEATLEIYVRTLELFEKHKFKSTWLKERQARMHDAYGRPAYEQVARLSKIVERIGNRENSLFVPLNILLLWDYQCMLALTTWKKESGHRLITWLETLAEVEAVSSLANIRFEHPDWAMPIIVSDQQEPTGLSAKGLGHPLIMQNRVCNDFRLPASAPMALITGSNMAGKSTFLRSVGINLVLAYAGAPVCAESFRCSQFELWTSMRTMDSLGQGVSSFYAEVLRIKRIVDAAKSKRRILCLLDEVFKGTNSHDRHRAAKALVTRLLEDGAFGLISTHDLELTELGGFSEGRIRNYHFREQYQNGKISFDYKLRRGAATTRNALHLIKMMGITTDP